MGPTAVSSRTFSCIIDVPVFEESVDLIISSGATSESVISDTVVVCREKRIVAIKLNETE